MKPHSRLVALPPPLALLLPVDLMVAPHCFALTFGAKKERQ